MALFHCFLWLSNIPIYIYHSFFVHSSPHRQLGCSHVLSTVNSTAVNLGIQVSFIIRVFFFSFSKYIPNSGNGGSYGNSTFSFSRNCHNVLHSDCFNLHSHRECKSVPFLPHSIIYCLQIWGWWPFWLVWGDTWLYISFAFLW